MNYITNYYKNLSEKLSDEVRVLENQVKQLHEAYGSYGTAPGSLGMGASPAFSFAPPRQQQYPINSILSSWGSQNSQQDLNGDGVVDGMDLGIGLGGGLQSVGNPTQMNTTGFGTMPSMRTGMAGAGTQRSSFGRGFGQPGAPSMAPGAPSQMGARPQPMSGQFRNPNAPQAGGGPVPGDLNGDGVVDGQDLGIALGQGGNNYQQVLQGWGIPASTSTPSQMGQRRTQMGQRRRRR